MSGLDQPSIADWLTAGAALGGLVLVLAQIRHSSRVTAIETARQFITESRDRWAACMVSAGTNPFVADHFRRDLAQLIAHLELSVAAITEMSFPDALHLMIERTIVSFFNQMISSSYDDYLKEIFSDPAMCPCLRSFALQRVNIFGDGHRVMQSMHIASWRYT